MAADSHLPSLPSTELDLLFDCKSLDDFVATTMRILPPLVGSDVTSYNEFDVIARRQRIAIDDEETELHFLAHPKRNLAALLADNPLVRMALQGDRTAYRISDFTALEAWKKTEVYKLFFGPMDLQYQTALVLETEPTQLVAFAFNRRTEDFSDTDLAVLNALRPHVTRAYRVAVAIGSEHARRERREEMLGQFGVLWVDLDPQLNVLDAAPGALALLTQYHPISPHGEARLPSSVEDWALDAVTTADADATMVTHSQQGRLIVSIFGSIEEDGLTLMLEHVTFQRNPAPLQAFGLTRRQSEVLFWLAQGKSNTEIAVILGVSPRTIDNTVYRIFDTLKVSNRTNAAQIAWDVLSRRGPELE